MQLGMIGLGRMGANMVRRLMRGGHAVRRLRRRTADAVEALVADGADRRALAGGVGRRARSSRARSG